MSAGGCIVKDCDRQEYQRRMCRSHYRRWLREADPSEKGVCSVTGCSSRAFCRSMCSMHYQRFVKDGTVGASERRVAVPGLQCTVDGCERVNYGKGLCNMHYQRAYKNGEVGGPAPLKNRGKPWINRWGYVVLTVDGARKMEHRHVMEQLLGRPLLPEETIHHRNGVRHDNRPENLELWVSQRSGQRVTDLIAYLVQYHRGLVEEALG